MKSHYRIAAVAALGLTLTGCASQGETVSQPAWISNKYLQGSPCHCGGVLPTKFLKAQEKARLKAKKDGI